MVSSTCPCTISIMEGVLTVMFSPSALTYVLLAVICTTATDMLQRRPNDMSRPKLAKSATTKRVLVWQGTPMRQRSTAVRVGRGPSPGSSQSSSSSS